MEEEAAHVHLVWIGVWIKPPCARKLLHCTTSPHAAHGWYRLVSTLAWPQLELTFSDSTIKDHSIILELFRIL